MSGSSLRPRMFGENGLRSLAISGGVVNSGSSCLIAGKKRVLSEDEMEISDRKVGKITIIKVQGQAVIDQKPERLSQLTRDRLQAGDRLFVINLSSCSRMDSTGLGELVKSQKLV